MSKLTRLLTLVVIACITTIAPSCAITWNAAADYHTAWTASSNPYGAWSYGYTSNTASNLGGGYTFGLMTAYDTSYWAHERMNGVPGASVYSAVYYNPSDTDNPNSRVPAHALALLPANTGYKTIVRFTASGTGAYVVNAAFQLGWPDQASLVDAHVVKYVNSSNVQVLTTSVLAGGATTSLSYSNSVSLNSGESLDFVVGDGGNGQGYDMTILGLTITYNSSGTVSGVVNGPSGPIEGATVKVVGGSATATTAGDGSYTMELIPGTYTLKATKGGYVSDSYGPFTLSNGQTIDHDFELTEPSWVQVGSTLVGPYANADNTTVTNYTLPGGIGGVKFSPTMGDIPAELSSVVGYFRNMKVTYSLNVAAVTGYGNQYGSNGGLALYLADSPDALTGLYSGVYNLYSGGWINRGALCANSAFSTRPGGPDFAISHNCDVELTIVDGLATTTLTGVNSQTFEGASTDVSNWAGKMKFAAFESDPLWDNNFYCTRATVTNVAFYKDELQAPPPMGYVSGTVTMNFGTSHPVASGATVRTLDGAHTTMTNASGLYSLELAPGTYTLVVSKPNCEDQQVSGVVVVDQQTTTKDFDLTTSFIAGQVTSSATGQPVVGAALVTTDGLASATTDSMGNYSLQVKSGTYTVEAYKYGFLLKTASASPGVGATAPLNLSLDLGWDLAADFGTSNPNGVWSYHQYDGSVESILSIWGWGWDPLGSYTWHYTPGAGFSKNKRYTPVETAMGYGTAYREPRKVVTEPCTGGDIPAGSLAIARFTAPTPGYYTVSARWAGVYPAGTGTHAQVELYHNGTSLYSDYLDGFTGKAENGYSDAVGPKAILTSSQNMNLAAGDVIETVVGLTEAGLSHWAQVDLTVKPAAGASVVSGTISAANLPGTPGIPNAQVEFTLGAATISTVTDATGSYFMSMQPGNYQMRASASGFSTENSTVNATAGNVAKSMSLTHSGTWDVAADYTTVCNPNLQWSYGFSRTLAEPLIPYGNMHQFGTTFPAAMSVWTYYDSAQGGGGGYSPWYAWVGKNTSNELWEMTDAGEYTGINPGEITFGGGGCWYNLGQPVGAVLPRIRWTSPSSGIVNINMTVRSHSVASLPAWGYLTVAKNNAVMAVKGFEGYAGTAALDYTDAYGAAPVVNFQTTVKVAQGDTIDFMQGRLSTDGFNWWIDVFGYPWKSMGLSGQITPGAGDEVSSISGLKDAPVGSTVILTAPVSLVSATDSFGDGSFYVENDDRVQGIKCIGNADTPWYVAGTKITFTGTIGTDAAGQKVVLIKSINSAAAADIPGPLGTGSKGLGASNTLVRVWGNLKEKVANSDSGTNGQWPYLEWVINDGANDVVILMNAQRLAMNSTLLQNTVQVGHTIAVTGIATKNAEGELVVIPTSDGSFSDFSVEP